MLNFNEMKKINLLLCAVAAFAAVSCNSCPSTSENAAVENIMNRKSVRSWNDQPVSDEDITTMLKAAMAAPSGMNVQPWSFVVLKDKSNFEKMFEGNFNLKMFNEAPVVIVVCADTTHTRPSRENPEEKITGPNRIWRDDLGACTENLLLAAESLGLGAVWTACYPFEDRYMPVKEALGLPETVVPYCIVPVGHPAAPEQPKDKWKPERIHYDRW